MIDKVKTKEELKNKLKSYKSILTSDKVDYLNSLIELEFSTVRDYITDDEKNILSQLDLYRDIVIYNIYNKAFKILSNYEDVSKVGNNENNEFLKAYIDGKLIYEFNYKTLKVNEAEKIGSIVLTNALFNEDVRDKEIERVINKIDWLKKEQNPFSHKSSGFHAINWDFTHHREIEKYEKLLDEYSYFKVMNDKDKKRIEIINNINNDLLDDYNISFDRNDEIIDMTKSLMNKEYIKKLPDVNVKNKIRYI